MKIKFLLKLAAWILYLSISSAGYGDSNVFEVIEVRRVLDKVEQNDCVHYRLLAFDEKVGLLEKEYCLSEDVDYSSGNSYIWIIDKKRSKLKDKFSIFVYSKGKEESERAIVVKTDEYPFELSDYFGFLIPPFAGNNGEYLCVLGADGIISAVLFKNTYHDRMQIHSQLVARKKLEKKIREAQPWCK